MLVEGGTAVLMVAISEVDRLPGTLGSAIGLWEVWRGEEIDNTSASRDHSGHKT